jgi:hypothetical protein
MRLAIVPLLFLCGAAFGQDTPDQNAAAESAKKRILGMKLMRLPSMPAPNMPRSFPRIVRAAKTPGVCAIPLLNVLPPGSDASSRMPVIKPGRIREPQAQVPAPACPEGLFQK